MPRGDDTGGRGRHDRGPAHGQGGCPAGPPDPGVTAACPVHPRVPRRFAPELAEQEVAGGQRDRLRGHRGELGGRGGARRPRWVTGRGPDGLRETPGHLRETDLARGEQRIQVFHGAGMAAEQPPSAVEFLLAQLPDGRQRFRQFESPGAGQRADIAESEWRPGGCGLDEWMAAGNEQFAPMSSASPACHQFSQGGITNFPAAGIGRHVVIEVVQSQQDRNVGEDVFAEQCQPVRPRHVGLARHPCRFRPAAAGGRGRMTAEGGGHPRQHPVHGRFAADDRRDPLGIEVAHPRGDLAGQRGLADSADSVQHQPGQRGTGEVWVQRRRSADRIGRDACGSGSGSRPPGRRLPTLRTGSVPGAPAVPGVRRVAPRSWGPRRAPPPSRAVRRWPPFPLLRQSHPASGGLVSPPLVSPLPLRRPLRTDRYIARWVVPGQLNFLILRVSV